MATPVANYAHAVHVQNPTEWIVTSGVVPTVKDGAVPSGISAQADAVWANIRALLSEKKFKMSDIVSVTTYVVATPDLQNRLSIVMASRDAALGGHRAASTLVTVPALARPEWLMEIAVVAAK